MSEAGGNGDGDSLFQEVLGLFDAPAYVRRARGVEAASEALLDRCRARRAELLEMVRPRVGLLAARAGDWNRLRPLLADDAQLVLVQHLHATLAPRLRAVVAATASTRVLRRALRDLCESIQRFNRRWREFLHGLDLTAINTLRDGYNRYYVLEKEFAVRSARIARHGFAPLAPLTLSELEKSLPLLPAPLLMDQRP